MPQQRSWLLDGGSLTRRLIRLCGDEFNVQLLQEQRNRPHLDEAKSLSIRWGEQARVREVYLCAGSRPLVYARTVIPFSTLQGPARRLAHLGGRPLGALLFSSKGMRRAGIQVSRLPGSLLQDGLSDEPVWGRRSVFYLADKPLIVSEYFLPSLFELLGGVSGGGR
ncbi:MAG: chorismate lyase [Gammaproteobacteria bacterium]|nr:chorismate lyase [Gammaproteobacteria bacterium]MCF6230960.1 chorismate lyase [Gammaproteobacteria bacterium]